MTQAQRDALTAAMIRLADGDRAAFGPVFDLLWPALTVYARSLLGDAPQAEEAAQRALLKVFEQASAFRPDGDALTWALAITTWECRTARRQASRRREVPDPADALDALPARGCDVEAALLAKDLERALAAVLDRLEPRDREALRLSLDDGAAGAIGAAARKRKERAVSRLRAMWRAVHGDL